MDNESCNTPQHIGKVVKVSKNSTTVEIVRSAECEGCKACVFASKKRMKIPVSNTVGAKAGDTVIVSPPPAKPITAYLVLFGLPLVMLVAGLLLAVALTDKEAYYFVGIAVGLAVGLISVLTLDRLYYSKRYLAEIIKIQQGEINND